jgi:FAD/FMN-containing dehydrogenase
MPESARNVSIAVLLARSTQCPFATKSGGHAAFTGASNIEGGISISLEKLNEVSISTDWTAVVGAGNVWRDVYTALQPTNVTVIGGRVSNIGVSGLTTGGGISFFSNVYGWACDNVASYEIVTAAGVIMTVSPDAYPDLYFALRGGGNNFGIVTKFDLNIVPLPGHLMWGGSRVSTPDQFPALTDAFIKVGRNSPSDPLAAQILSFAYVQAQNLSIASADLQYSTPDGASAPIFQEYLAIPAVVDSTFARTLTNLTEEFASKNPSGFRETYWTATSQLSTEHLTFIKDVFYEELESIKDAAGLVPAATLQVITEGQLAGMIRHGGNPLGLSQANGPYLLLNLNTQWTSAADDERIFAFNRRVIDRSVARAKKMGIYEEYKYMNYASQFDDVIASYGAKNKARLIKVAKKYDPKGVFQRLVPGYFKLEGPPVSS